VNKRIIKNGRIINDGKIISADILIVDDRIERIDSVIDSGNANEIVAEGKYVMPGIIDDQVHFREPGLTHKANIATESKAALAGGTTSFMEMPNTKPTATTQTLLQDKYDVAQQTAYTNYSFFMGATNDNIEEVLKTDKTQVCGIKVFMGSSTGNMLVDNRSTLDKIFSNVDHLIATHCEDEATIRKNMKLFEEKYGSELNATHHPMIRNREGCLISSSLAVELAKKHNTRLHILHISTKDELALFTNQIEMEEKRITSEACVHHMYFNSEDYVRLGNKIKCNPAIKDESDRAAIFEAVFDDRIDIIATDHAPHTVEEKSKPYSQAPSGLPLVQHSLNMMLDFYHKGEVSLERIVDKMCHAPARCFKVDKRGYAREGYFADLAILDLDKSWTVNRQNIHFKCGWSPLENKRFKGRVEQVLVNGKLAYDNGNFVQGCGARMTFNN